MKHAFSVLSLFRAVSEQLYLSQRYFEELQQITEDYVKRHPDKFTGMDVVDTNLKALSELFDREIFIFSLGQKEPVNVSKRVWTGKEIFGVTNRRQNSFLELHAKNCTLRIGWTSFR